MLLTQDHLKNLSFLEGELDELDGLGQLLCRECVKPDGKVIQQRIEELRCVCQRCLYTVCIQ